MATKKVKKSLVSSFLCLLTLDIVLQIIGYKTFENGYSFLGCFGQSGLTAATDELLCFKNVGTQMSMFFTSNE